MPNPNMRKGAPSVNPSGRPSAWHAKLATHEDRALKVLTDAIEANDKDAARWLLEQLRGRAPQRVDAGIPPEQVRQLGESIRAALLPFPAALQRVQALFAQDALTLDVAHGKGSDMPVTETLTWACDNFANCGTPPVTGTGLPPGWSDSQINGQRVILCQIDTPTLVKSVPAVAAATAVATNGQ